MSQTVRSIGGLVLWRSCCVSCQTFSLVLSLSVTPQVRRHLCEISQKPKATSFGLRVYYHPVLGFVVTVLVATFMVRHLRCGAGCMLGTLTVTLTRNVRGVSGSMCDLPVPPSLTEAIFCRGHVSMVIPSNRAGVWSGGLAAAAE